MDDAERNLTVVFGPSRSKFFPKAVAYARAVATEVAEPEPGRYRIAFTLGADPDPYAHASALIERVRRWQGSEVYLGPIPVSPVIAKNMGWCAGDQLRRHGTCRYRYFMGVPRRCPRVRCTSRSEPRGRCEAKWRLPRSALKSSSARTFGPCFGGRSHPRPRFQTSCPGSGRNDLRKTRFGLSSALWSA